MPRPRDARIDDVLIGAWHELAAERDYDAITMEAIAAKAGVGKPALYRRFRTKAHLAFAAAVVHAAPMTVADRGDVRSELLDCVSTLADSLMHVPRQVFADQVSAVVVDAAFAAEVAAFHARSDATVQSVLERAVSRGEIDDSLDLHAAVLDLGGALIFNVMVRHRAADRAYQEQLVDRMLSGMLKRPS